jgi:hypothetical protein
MLLLTMAVGANDADAKVRADEDTQAVAADLEAGVTRLTTSERSWGPAAMRTWSCATWGSEGAFAVVQKSFDSCTTAQAVPADPPHDPP